MQKRILLMSLIFLSSTPLALAKAACTTTCQHHPWWVDVDLLYWSIRKDSAFIPFVTTASLSDALPGALGQPGTSVLLSNCNLNPDSRIGFRVFAGARVDECKDIDIEGNYFLLPTEHRCCSVVTSGEPGSLNLAVPVYDVSGVWGLNGVAGETIADLPGPLDGAAGFYGDLKLCGATQFQGAEILALFQLCGWDRSELFGSVGFGWMRFFEELTFIGQTYLIPGAIEPLRTLTPPTSEFPFFFNFVDQFKTKNNFYGALFGLRGQRTRKRWTFKGDLIGGLGLMHNAISIDGGSRTDTGNLFFVTDGTGGEILTGGIFTQPSNIGCSCNYRWGGMLEAIVRVGYSVTQCIELSLGYDFMLLTTVARAADQIDRAINSTMTSLAVASRATVGVGPGPVPFGMPAAAPAVEGPVAPVRLCRPRAFWAQGLIVGFMIDF